MRIKKLLLVLVLLFTAQSCFAVDIQELNIEFFKRFNDENLNCYIQDALNNNHDLKKAGHVVEQYRQQTKYSLGKELPSFSVSANYLGIKVPQLDNFMLKENAFILPFMASYEADLLLKNMDKTKSVKKSWEAAKFNEKAIYLALLTDVATVYTNILQYDDLIERQTKIVKNQEEILNRSIKKYERGVISLTELNNAKKSVEAGKSSLEKLQKERETAMMQLAVLTGNSSSNIADMKVGNLESFEYSGVIPDEISSDVIFSRPDVKMAEANLEKAKIDVRVAKREFLPKFIIFGQIGLNAYHLDTLFNSASQMFNAGILPSIDLFAGGRKIALLKLRKFEYEEALNSYQKTILTGIKDMNSGLVEYKEALQNYNESVDRLSMQNKTYSLMKDKHFIGAASDLDILYAKEAYLMVRKDEVSNKINSLISTIGLYKASGGVDLYKINENI